MSKIVAVPNVGNVEFPDTMSDDEIGAAIQKQIAPSQPEPKPQEATWADKIRANHPWIDMAATAGETADKMTPDPVHIIAGQMKAPLVAGYKVARALGLVEKNPDYEAMITPQTGSEKFGAATSDAVPFIAAEGPIAAASKAAGAVGGTAAKVATRIAGRFAAGTGIAAAEGSDHPVIAGAANAALPEVFDVVGTGLKKLGEKFITSQIRPNGADIKAGFRTANVTKYGLQDGSLESTLDNTHDAIVQRAGELRQITANPTAPKVDVNAAIDKVEQDLLSREGRMKLPADEVAHVRNALGVYRDWANDLPGGADLTLDEAQTLKRAVGLKGAWEYGKSAADSGIEKVSNALYGQLKNGIEQGAGAMGPRVTQINKELGELMPVEQAIIRRIPVASRNNPLSLTDLMLFATGHPEAAAAHVLSRSMLGASATHATGRFLSKVAPATGAAGAGAVSSASQ